jgi:NADH-quinone oxidoreductase subunit C
MRTLANDIAERFEAGPFVERRADLATLDAAAKHVPELLARLRDRHGYAHLSFVTATDLIEEGVFVLTYMLHNHAENHSLAVKCRISREHATMESCHRLWEQMWTYQRELKELFGIDFPGSPRVDESFVLEGWIDIPPMRREFDTREYSERTFPTRPGRSTIDPATHMKSKLYPEAL